MSPLKKLALIGLVALPLAGCLKEEPIDQAVLCTYSTDAEAKLCKPGQMSWFKAGKAINQSLPLSVAAAYCDFNYQVMYNEAGVICVFTDKRLSLVK
ncbi:MULTISPECIES: hypothetical protein [Pseudomonas]|uniref:hypothetical protein n=1 Tax=Pseudomonadaceae TaxID=135621 RepID=UPI000412CC88|nr:MULTISPECIES: hypothetical protein [Pseudomonas]MDE3735354.1 hypothetical protein [Pseudomonas resinovorans]MDH4581712.1 hypothetical protein [Pseudomonas sp. BN415]